MELKDTAKMMISNDYVERFKAEYYQLNIRINSLETMLKKYREGILNFEPKCPYDLLNSQLISMKRYQLLLKDRAKIEKIEIGEI